MLLFSYNEVILTYTDTETSLIYILDILARYAILRNSLYKLVKVLFGSYRVLGILTLSIEFLVEYLSEAKALKESSSVIYSN
jgi:hypothetical protein